MLSVLSVVLFEAQTLEFFIFLPSYQSVSMGLEYTESLGSYGRYSLLLIQYPFCPS